MAVGFVGVAHGFKATTVVVAVGGKDAALPGAGLEAAGIGVGVVGAVAVVVFLSVEVAGGLVVDPGGGGSGGSVGGEGFSALGVVVGVGGAVGLCAGGFLNGAVGIVVGDGDVFEGVVAGVDGVRGIDMGAAAARIVGEGGDAVAGVEIATSQNHKQNLLAVRGLAGKLH